MAYCIKCAKEGRTRFGAHLIGGNYYCSEHEKEIEEDERKEKAINSLNFQRERNIILNEEESSARKRRKNKDNDFER